jgi:hypothetical protein
MLLFSFIMLSVILLSIIMQRVIMLSVIMLSVIMLTVIMLIDVAPHMKALNETSRSKTIIVQALIPFSKSNQPHNMFKNVFT